MDYVPIRRWVMESIIIVSTFCNQTSPQSSNAWALVSNNLDPRSIQKEAWKVKSFFGYSAFSVQAIAAMVCVLISGVFTSLGIQ